MQKELALAAILLAGPALAADKSPPATLEDLLAMRSIKPALAGCYVETSVAGTFLATGSRATQAGVGGGCDAVIGKAIVGAGLRADFVEGRTGSLFGKLGIALNPSTSLYGLILWSVPDWKIRDAGQLHLGAGTEISLSSFAPNMSLFVEGSSAVSKFGPAVTRDDVMVRLGARYRF